MTSLSWIEISVAFLSLCRVGVGQVECGTTPSAKLSCDSTITIVLNQTFYRLESSRARLLLDRPRPSGSLLNWQRRSGPLGSVTQIVGVQNPQLIIDGTGSLVIDPINQTVDGWQFRYTIQSSLFVLLNQSEWITARLGTEPSLRCEDCRRSLDVRLGGFLDFRINVTGVPGPTHRLKNVKNDDDLECNKYQLMDGRFRFGPVQESDASTYLLTARNCLGNTSLEFNLNVLIDASSDTTGYNITVDRGDSVKFTVNGSGYPQPMFTWIFKSVDIHADSREVECLDSIMQPLVPDSTTALAAHKFQSVLDLGHVEGNMTGSYHCQVANGYGNGDTVAFNLLVRDVPAAPNVTASATDETVTLNISKPCYTGSLPITNYNITYGNTDLNVTAPAGTTILVVRIPELMSKTPYQFAVRAVNDFEQSISNLTQITTLGVPDVVVLSSTNRSRIQDFAECDHVTFDVPAHGDGGSHVLDYELKCTPSEGSSRRKTVSSAVSISDLKELHSYTCQLRARNIYGYGDFSASFNFSTPACSSSSSPQPIWIWIVVAIAVLAVIIIIISIVLYKRKQKMKNSRRSEITEYDTSVEAYAESGPSARREESEAYATTAAARNGTGKNTNENEYAAASEAKRKSEPTEEVEVIEEIEAYAITGGAARYGGAQKSGKNKNVTKAEAKRESEPSKKVEIIGEMEAYATSSEVRGGAAPKATSNPKTSQAKPSENQPSQTPLPVYAAINPAGKKKKPFEKDTQNPGLQYADLDTSDMKPGPVPPAGQGVSYSDMNFELQPRGSTGPLLGTEQPAPAQPPPGTE